MVVKGKVSKDEMTKDGYEYASTVLRMRSDPAWFVKEHLGINLYPVQEEMFREFYRNKYDPSKSSYKHLVLALGMRSGKTALSGVFAAIELMDICTISNPSKHYGLLKNQGISVLATATSLDQALEGVFGNCSNVLEGSDFVNSWMGFKFKTDKIECPDKNVFMLALGSWASTAVGRSAKAVFFDELDNYEDTTSKRGATEVYSRLIKATDTLGADGHTFALSSLKSPTGIMMSLCKDAEDQKRRYGDKSNTLAYIRPTWEVNPHFTKEALLKEHENNLPAFWRDFGCVPSIYNSLAFPNGVVMEPITNVLLTPPISREGQPHRIMAIDPAVKKDNFGIACGYKAPSGKIIIDGVHKFTKKEGNIMIMPSDVRAYLDRVLPTLNVRLLLYDIWMFPDVLENVMRKGIKIEQHMVDYNSYQTWLDLESVNKTAVVYNDDLRLECDKLVVIPSARKPKVDHPLTGCFTGDTRVVLLDGTTPMISELDGKEVWVLSTDADNNPKAGKARGRLTKHVTELYEIILDSGASIKCTPDHLFMLRDGSYKPAKDLREYSDRLMPCYISQDSDGYSWFRNKQGIKAPLHRYLMDVVDSKDLVVHHKDENKSNNVPDNLIVMSRAEHSRMHGYTRNHDTAINAMYKFNISEDGKKLRQMVGLNSPIANANTSQRMQWMKKTEAFREDITIYKIALAKDKGALNCYSASKMLKCGRNVIVRVLRENDFKTWDEFALGVNHRIKSIYKIKLDVPIPVYDLEVDEWNNFALLSGVFVHNSKDMADCCANVIQYLYENKMVTVPKMTGLRGF